MVVGDIGSDLGFMTRTTATMTLGNRSTDWVADAGGDEGS